MAIKKKEVPVIVKKPHWPRFYVVACLVVLAASTAFWAYLGARLQSGNADQLVNSYLFESGGVFRGAYFPSQHTFILKWPLFIAIKLFGASSGAFVIFTMLITLLTVGLLAYMLWRIERRPYVFGALCLALASVLLLIPAVPYPGALLPVNMAMVATRNLEYVLYIAALALIIRSPRIRNWRFFTAVAVLGLLIASDKLFLSLTLGGAGLVLLVYGFMRRWSMVSLAVKWLVSGLIGVFVAVSLLWFIDGVGLTHIISQGGVGPYSFVNSIKNLALGSLYAALGILTNFGANPASGATLIKQIPHQALTGLVSTRALSYFLNGLIFLAALMSTVYVVFGGLSHKLPKHPHNNAASKMTVLLGWSSVVIIGLFIISNHYYAVDARYLTITLFTGFIALATVVTKREWPLKWLIISSALLLIGILGSLNPVLKTYQVNAKALAEVNERDTLIAQVLERRKVDVLVGDYWRVIPTKQQSKSHLNVLPLSDCTHSRDVLTSQEWKPSLQNHRFAYLLSFDQRLTDYPACSLDQVTKAYGRPNASFVVAGSVSDPKELLLFYDVDSHNNPKAPTTAQSSATVLPINLADLQSTNCPQPTIMNIVAHEDDDLLFLSPDLEHDIQEGHCVRTVYLTAGDAGSGEFYWLGRQQGSEAAYSKLLKNKDIWIERDVKISDNQFVTIANPKGNNRISLIFMRLPDGNITGQGFGAYRHESLARLETNAVPLVHSVDNQSKYSSQQLIAALSSLMHTYQPTEIHTQANYTNFQFPDHSDHMAVGRYVDHAYQKYEQEQFEGKVLIPIIKYIGYPVHSLSDNVFGDDLLKKEAAFIEYGRFDGSVCHSTETCEHTATYRSYIHRQYYDPQ